MNFQVFKKHIVIRSGSIIGLFMAPSVVFATHESLDSLFFGNIFGFGGSTLGSILFLAADIISFAISVVFALALLFFFWGVAKYILSAGDEESVGTGRRFMVGGIVALLVMVSVWGLVF